MQTSRQKRLEGEQTRIESYGEGVGLPTPEAVERRARELAQMEGRTREQVTEDDRERASQEIHDQGLSLSSDEVRSNLVATANPADMAVEAGHRVENGMPADEQENTEVEFKEGLREAEHERMLKAQRQGTER